MLKNSKNFVRAFLKYTRFSGGLSGKKTNAIADMDPSSVTLNGLAGRPLLFLHFFPHLFLWSKYLKRIVQMNVK